MGSRSRLGTFIGGCVRPMVVSGRARCGLQFLRTQRGGLRRCHIHCVLTGVTRCLSRRHLNTCGPRALSGCVAGNIRIRRVLPFGPRSNLEGAVKRRCGSLGVELNGLALLRGAVGVMIDGSFFSGGIVRCTGSPCCVSGSVTNLSAVKRGSSMGELGAGLGSCGG